MLNFHIDGHVPKPHNYIFPTVYERHTTHRYPFYDYNMLIDNSEILLYKTILALKKLFEEIHFLGIQGRGKGHKVKHLKII